MSEMKEKAMPGYKNLSDRLAENSDKIDAQSSKQEQIIELLTSLNKYHGNPEDKKGWLEKVYDVEMCRKKLDKESRHKGGKRALFALVLTVIAMGIEVTRNGDDSVVSGVARWLYKCGQYLYECGLGYWF